jgi:HEPN domain-containing protein
MSREAERAAEVREWLAKVTLDLRGARIDLAANPPLIEYALFHCQQAVEKAFKAFLAWNDSPFRKTHSLEELGRACCLIDGTLEALVDEVVPLTEYAWAFRYPGALPDPEVDEGREALVLAERVVAAIAGRLPEKARPPGFELVSS